MAASDKIALASLIIAGLSFLLTLVTIKQTRKHNRLSVKPILEFIPMDFIGYIKISIKNSGTGPLIRKEIKCSSKTKSFNHLIDLMPDHDSIKWNNYSKFDSMVILPNETETLIEIKGDESDEQFKLYITEIRKILSETILSCEYQDIYEQDFIIDNFKLNYCFGRHFKKKLTFANKTYT